LAGEITAGVDAEKFQRALDRYPVKLHGELVRRVGPYLKKWVRREIAMKKFRDPLRRRTGTLSRAFDSISYGSNINNLRFVTGTVHQEVPYANIHEFGGVIHAKPGKFLTIPLGAAKNLSGVAKFTARAAMEEENVAIIKTSRALMIVRKHPTRWEPLFLLVKEVKIPARLGFYAAFKDQIPELEKQMDKAIDAALKPDPAERTA